MPTTVSDFLFGRRYRYAIMHDKFVVVDGETVETGLFNSTIAAEKHNAVIVLHDSMGESEDLSAHY
jgi:phosphatidylserine/phosphatidylglycerophosphate/cardiolipin synthase-like enzyme